MQESDYYPIFVNWESGIRHSYFDHLLNVRFGERMKGTGVFAELVAKRFAIAAERLGFGEEPELDSSGFQPPVLPGQQLAIVCVDPWAAC